MKKIMLILELNLLWFIREMNRQIVHYMLQGTQYYYTSSSPVT
jgi:hypothetical protein